MVIYDFLTYMAPSLADRLVRSGAATNGLHQLIVSFIYLMSLLQTLNVTLGGSDQWDSFFSLLSSWINLTSKVKSIEKVSLELIFTTNPGNVKGKEKIFQRLLISIFTELKLNSPDDRLKDSLDCRLDEPASSERRWDRLWADILPLAGEASFMWPSRCECEPLFTARQIL